jgi:PAT family beta-lactamase induction signal transducer AmpG
MRTRLHNWGQSFLVYRNPRVVAMLFLGFSAGLPLLLVFGTLSAWLRVEGVDKTTIGFVSWVALAYGFKFVWSPLVDRMPLPGLTTILGKRRGWMLLAQAGIIFGLLAMSGADPRAELALLVAFAVVTAFSSATQDIAIDAWRIEALDDEYQGAMAGAYQLGYRLGMILAGGGAFSLAHFYSWPMAYRFMALCMLIGVVTVLLIPEPDHKQNGADRGHINTGAAQRLQQWFTDAVVAPFAEFFNRYGTFALIVLLFILVFRISDITLGVMANPFYIDMGYSELEIGIVTKTVGPVITISGALLGGVLVMRYGLMRMLLVGAVLVVLTNLLFALLATRGPELVWLIAVVGADNLAAGIATTSFVAYLSSLTNQAYTATQYALFSSIMLLLAKFVAGFSGVVVDATSYPVFFVYAAALGIPSILLIPLLSRYQQSREALAS